MKTDLELQKDVVEELQWDPLLTASEIGVSVKNGVVTLSGHVNSYFKKLAAEKAVKRVKGVLAVAEDILVVIGGNEVRDDTDIAIAATESLKWDSRIPGECVILKVENGWVTIEGTVEWQYQKDAATDVVRNITGIKGVVNIIKVLPQLNTTIIENNIKRALERSAAIEAEHITVQTQGSKVILTGKVRSWTERQEVKQAAWSSPGVVEVEDELQIEN